MTSVIKCLYRDMLAYPAIYSVFFFSPETHSHSKPRLSANTVVPSACEIKRGAEVSVEEGFGY